MLKLKGTLHMMISLMLISTNCQLIVPHVPIMGFVFSITITSLADYQGLLTTWYCAQLLPVSGKNVSWRKFWVGGAALCVCLNIQKGEHAPVVEADDGPHPGTRPVPGRRLDVLHPRVVEGEARLHQPVLRQTNKK